MNEQLEAIHQLVVRPNQVWDCGYLWGRDCGFSEIQLMDGIFIVVAVVDVYSRRASISITTEVLPVTMLRTVALQWGMPDTVTTEWYSPKLNQQLPEFNIQICQIYESMQAGCIAQFFSLFIANKLKTIEKFNAISSYELQTECNIWLDQIYYHTAQKAINGKTPCQVWEAG